MDQKYIEDQHVVARYLADQLSDSDREAFEGYCREHPEMFREIEATARFKVGLAKLADTRELDAIVEKPAGPGVFVWRHAAAIGGVALATAVLLGALYAFKVPAMGTSVAEVSGHFRSALPVAADYELLRMRDSGDIDLRVQLPASPGAIHIRVLPDAEDSAAYRATLSRDAASGAQTIASVSGLKPDDKHFVSLFVSSTKLAPGTYSLIVTPEAPKPGEAESSFRLAVELAH